MRMIRTAHGLPPLILASALFALGGIAAAFHAVAPARAQGSDAPQFGFPVDCQYGEDCIIQNYVAWGGETPRDYQCGLLTYPTHKGTDVRILDRATMARGVRIFAAADGVVRGTRDGMADLGAPGIDKARREGRECGNGVFITHANGWSSQYCHMKQGSIAVRQGDTVRAGTVLGEVGLSGNTEFPHLHFVVRQNDQVVDPFVGPGGRPVCEGASGSPVWRADVAQRLTYEPVRIFHTGFSGTPVSLESINADTTSPAALPAESSVFLFWTRLIGLAPQYRVRMTVTGPDGATLIDTWLDPVDRHKAQWVSWTGRRGPLTRWQRGTYRGTVTVWEGNRTVTTRVQQVRLEN